MSKLFNTISMLKFGRDHWSLLAYIESSCVNSQGGICTIEKNRMRCNPVKHPLLSSGIQWKDEYGTRLAQFDPSDGNEESFRKSTQISGHDDWDCLDDLESSGFIEILSLSNPTVKMTGKGLLVSSNLREFKAAGGSFSRFSFPIKPDL